MKLEMMRKRRGVSLTESAIVLAIIGIVLGGVWAMTASMNRSVKQQKFSELLSVTVEKVRGIYTGKPSFESVYVLHIMPRLMEMSVFPSETVASSGGVSIVISPFGRFASNPNTTNTASPHTSFYVCGWASTGSSRCNLAAIPATPPRMPLFAVEFLAAQGDCIQAILRNSNPITQPGLVAVYSNNTQRTMPLTLATASTACSAAVNYVDFVYRLTP